MAERTDDIIISNVFLIKIQSHADLGDKCMKWFVGFKLNLHTLPELNFINTGIYVAGIRGYQSNSPLQMNFFKIWGRGKLDWSPLIPSHTTARRKHVVSHSYKNMCGRRAVVFRPRKTVRLFLCGTARGWVFEIFKWYLSMVTHAHICTMVSHTSF